MILGLCYGIMFMYEAHFSNKFQRVFFFVEHVTGYVVLLSLHSNVAGMYIIVDVIVTADQH